MAITAVDGTAGGTSANVTGFSFAMPSSAAVGDFIRIVIAHQGNTTISGVTDNVSALNVYAAATTLTNDGTYGEQEWYSEIRVAGTPTITVNFSGTSGFYIYCAEKYTGVLFFGDPRDGGSSGAAAAASATGTAANSGTTAAKTTLANELWGGGCLGGGAGGFTQPSGFTARQTSSAALVLADNLTGAAGSQPSYAPTLGTTGPWDSSIVVYQLPRCIPDASVPDSTSLSQFFTVGAY